MENNYPIFLKDIFHIKESPKIIIKRKAKELLNYSQSIHTWTEDEFRFFNDTLRHKNRYLYRIPYERNRVKLRYKGGGGGSDNGDDYINASFISWGEDEDNIVKYIASQAPVPSTFADFWHMVWEQNVTLIVSLVAVQKNRCEQYWPPTIDSQPLNFQGIMVSLTSEDSLIEGEVVKRKFLLEYGNESRSLCQIHYFTWPDHGIPKSYSIMQSILGYCHHHLQDDDARKSFPILVHCSAGIGRTGTFCVLHTILTQSYYYYSTHQLKGSKDDLVLDIIKTFRNQRNDMVETFEQLEFIYGYLNHHYSNPHPKNGDGGDTM